MLFKDTFLNKKVLVTGNTGFKGSWLTAWLLELGAEVYGISVDIPTNPSHFETAKLYKKIVHYETDICNLENLKKIIHEIRPDFVFHLAAQPLVRLSYIDPVATYQTNVLGTLNLLEALRLLEKPCTAVLITSDKCYDNVEWVWGYRETDSLGGSDPYSASKGAAELVIRSHVKSFFSKNGAVRIAVGRAGNVIGGGDWAQDRIVPDCVRAWAKGESVQLRNPQATRPWQHVLEPLSGYLALAAELNEKDELHGEPFNFGPPAHQNHSVLKLVQMMSEDWDQVHWEEFSDTVEQPHESGLLKLNCDKALHHLHWQAILSFQETVRMTAEWYSFYYKNPSTIWKTTLSQIKEYEAIALSKKMLWVL